MSTKSGDSVQNVWARPRGNKCLPAWFLRRQPADVLGSESRESNCVHTRAKALFLLVSKGTGLHKCVRDRVATVPGLSEKHPFFSNTMMVAYSKRAFAKHCTKILEKAVPLTHFTDEETRIQRGWGSPAVVWSGIQHTRLPFSEAHVLTESLIPMTYFFSS